MLCCFYKLIGVHPLLTEFPESYLHKTSVSWALQPVGDPAGEASFCIKNAVIYANISKVLPEQ